MVLLKINVPLIQLYILWVFALADIIIRWILNRQKNTDIGWSTTLMYYRNVFPIIRYYYSMESTLCYSIMPKVLFLDISNNCEGSNKYRRSWWWATAHLSLWGSLFWPVFIKTMWKLKYTMPNTEAWLAEWEEWYFQE